MLWHAGRNHWLRVTPARRRISARYGKPPTFGRTAIARLWAACKLSIALLTEVSFGSKLDEDSSISFNNSWETHLPETWNRGENNCTATRFTTSHSVAAAGECW